MVLPLNDKNVITATNAFQTILDENKSMKWWFQDNDLKMYSTHNKGKSIVAEIFLNFKNLQIYDFHIKVCVYW